MSPLAGVLAVLKPPGLSSHDIVAAIRRITGVRRVGHTGTLDVGAAGVLVVCLGPATRLVPYLQSGRKAYRVEATLGRETDTHDAGGRTVSTCETFSLSRSALSAAVAGLVGRQRQVPPLTSAVRVGGERLYRIARRAARGETGLESTAVAPQRWVTVYAATVLRTFPAADQLGPGARVLIDLLCSKGTYVRTWVAELGRALGCGAFVSFLLRTGNGPFRLEHALTLPEFAARWAADPRSAVVSPAEALAELPAVHLSPSGVERVRQGRAVDPASGAVRWDGEAAAAPGGAHVRMLSGDGELIAVGRPAGAASRTGCRGPSRGPSGPAWHPVRVLPRVDGP